MDPDKTLKEILRLVDRILLPSARLGNPEGPKELSEELALEVEVLHEWIMKGGFLPELWRQAR